MSKCLQDQHHDISGIALLHYFDVYISANDLQVDNLDQEIVVDHTDIPQYAIRLESTVVLGIICKICYLCYSVEKVPACSYDDVE